MPPRVTNNHAISVLTLAALLSPALAFSQDFPDFFDLPGARNIWAPLETQVAGVVSGRIDVGGLRSMAPSHFGGFGTTWTQNAFTIGALDLTDPYTGGVPLVDPDVRAFAPVRYL